MCGIIGIVGNSTVTDRLVDGLKRLEYRGYDSSGIAVLDSGSLKRQRAEGKIKELETKLDKDHMDGQIGIAHTRWATHGIPNETNSHPHFSGRVGVVHNGIIENFLDIRKELSHREFTIKFMTMTIIKLRVTLQLYLAGLQWPKRAIIVILCSRKCMSSQKQSAAHLRIILMNIA